MAYIGKQPVVGNFVKLDAIVTSATATYNLLNGGVAYSPQSANNCIVSLNGIIQEPTSSGNVGGYTISGSTIVFTSALTSLDVIDFILVLGDTLSIGTPSDGTVGFAKVTSNLITGATAETSIAGGDSVLIYDDSASALRKMTRTNFVAGVGGTNTPYFKAIATTVTGIPSATHTVINYDTEIYDSGSYYNTSTKRFTPLVAGYYFVYASILVYATPAFRDLTNVDLNITKNGTSVSRGHFDAVGTGTYYSVQINASTIVEMNGTTDYLDAQVYMTSNSGRNLEGASSQFLSYKIIT